MKRMKFLVALGCIMFFWSAGTSAMECYYSGGYDKYYYYPNKTVTEHYPTYHCTVGQRYSATNPYIQGAAWYQSSNPNNPTQEPCYDVNGVTSIVVPPGEIEVSGWDVLTEDDFRAYAWKEMAEYVQENWGGKTAKTVNITFTYSAEVGAGEGYNEIPVLLTLPEGKSLYEAIIDEKDGSGGMDLEKDDDILEESQCVMPGVRA